MTLSGVIRSYTKSNIPVKLIGWTIKCCFWINHTYLYKHSKSKHWNTKDNEAFYINYIHIRFILLKHLYLISSKGVKYLVMTLHKLKQESFWARNLLKRVPLWILQNYYLVRNWRKKTNPNWLVGEYRETSVYQR